jgi:ribokinase
MIAFDAIGFGALNMDKLFKVDKLVREEDESFVHDIVQTPGGSAANTMVGLSRLGCKVGFIGKVADDLEGRELLDDFRKENVDVNGIILSKQGRSGQVMGFVGQEGERALYVDPGVNSMIRLSEVKQRYAFGTKFLHLTSFVGEESFNTQKALVEVLPKSVKLSFDPGALYAKRGIRVLRPIIERTFVAMPNAPELKTLTTKRDYREGAESLLEEGVHIVAVKLGRRGCYVTDGIENHRIDPMKAKSVDSTGAGDAFCAGFLFGLISNRSLQECGKIGNFLGSRCVMKSGARTGLPTLDDLKRVFSFQDS